MKNIIKSLFFGILWIGIIYPLWAQQKAEEDTFLQTLQTELDRNYMALSAKDSLVYQITYRVEETNLYDIVTSFGTVSVSENHLSRTLYVEVRVGDHMFDNFHEWHSYMTKHMSTTPSVIKLPYGEDDFSALKQILWRETENKYREAVRHYQLVKVDKMIKVEADDKSPDYSGNPYTTYYESPQIVDFNTLHWETVLKNISAQFTDEQCIISGESKLRYYTTRKYFVCSDQSYTVQNNSYAYLYISINGQSEDGMPLPLYKSYFAHYPQELPESYQLIDDAKSLKKNFIALKKAPVVESYEGPVMLSKEVASIFFHEILVPHVKGSRIKNENDDQILKKQVGKQIFNPNITITFDPTVGSYNGLPLNGSYKYDDEGVKAEKVVVVDKGILRNFLMSRTPIENFPQSNGHARAQIGYQPLSQQSNLIVQTDHPYSETQLRQMLIQEAKEQGKEYGYYFSSAAECSLFNPNYFNMLPIEVYRIYVDGRPDELVRGVNWTGTPLILFSKIEALGNLTGNFSSMCSTESGNVPMSCCSPALLIKQIELQKRRHNLNIAPLIKRPTGEDNAKDRDFYELAFLAMEDEMSENFDHLHLGRLQDPFFIGYLITDAEAYVSIASLGSTIQSFQKPIRAQKTEVLVGNNQLNNAHYQDLNSCYHCNNIEKMAIENSYWNIRRSLWASTDKAYKTAAKNYEKKVNAITQHNLPSELMNLPDRIAPPQNKYIEENESPKPLISDMDNIAQNLSAEFKPYSNFTNSGVIVSQYRANALYLNSEGTRYRQPFNIAGIKVFAETLASDGEPLADCFTLYAPALEQLPQLSELIQLVHNMANKLEILRTARSVSENYEGPVLFTEEAVAEIFVHAFIENPNGILAARQSITSTDKYRHDIKTLSWYDNEIENLLDKKIIDETLSLTALDFISYYKDIPLIGNYKVDAEGVKVQNQLSIIKDGVLQTLLSNCTPTYKIKSSNGHQRLALSDGTLSTSLCPGILELSSSKMLTYNKLKKKLLSLAQKENKDYAYIIKKMVNREDLSSLDIDYTSETHHSIPVYIYQISVKDGSEKMVRMITLSDLTLKSFKQVEGVSDEQQVVNMLLKGNSDNSLYSSDDMPMNGVPCSFILPKAILFKNLKLRKNDPLILKKMPLVPQP